MSPAPEVAGCAVATRNYLADARLAARSFLDHHPSARFTIVVVDGDHTAPAGWSHRAVELVTPTELGLEPAELLTMAAIYDPAELACALKPWALRRALAHAEVAVYVDGDVEVLAPMPELIDAARHHEVVLVPHVLEPVPRDGRLPDEPGLLGAGMYNAGILACGPGSERFLDWWDVRLRRECLNQPSLMLHGDQRWLDFVPALFDHKILRDPAYDVAYWNLHERPTAWVDGQLCVVDRPVRCFHYSGLTDARPWMLSGFAGDRPRVTLAGLPAVARQCRGWLDRRRAVGADADRALGYHWARTGRGVPVDPRSRMLFRAALLAAEGDPTGATPVPPSPFAPDGGQAWEEWMRRPEAPGEVGRYLQQLWRDAPFLQQLFPDVPGADRGRYLAWLDSRAADEAAVPDPFRPRPEELDVPGAAAPPPPARRPPRPAADAQLPLDDLDRARAAHDQPARSAPGTVGKVVDRLLAGRDARSAEATAALADAVGELARRLADLSDRVDRARDTLHEHEGRSDELAAADGALRTEAEELGRRLGDVESGLATARGDLDGALEQDRITAGIVADAEERLADDLGDLRLRVAKLAVEVADEAADAATDDEEEQP
ncbi:MAG TPA: hypothetical protein VEW93_03665 [Acidimicrobiales bacterium]|nr:hypothetical protein [Acidimicrobiales bacterium]